MFWGSTVNFMLFNGVWTAFLATPYVTLAPEYFSAAGHRYLVLGVEVLTLLFWFAGFIALGASLPPARFCHRSICRSLQAATVFGALEWLFSLALFSLLSLPLFRLGVVLTISGRFSSVPRSSCCLRCCDPEESRPLGRRPLGRPGCSLGLADSKIIPGGRHRPGS